MSQKKKVRQQFRDAVFARDKNRCRMCGATGFPLDAHHITDRNEIPNGGYVLENGISLCNVCHEHAEKLHAFGSPSPGYHPDDLYALIGSSKEQAFAAAEKLTPHDTKD